MPEFDDYIRERFRYDEDTGRLLWATTNGRAVAGAVADQVAANGYLMVAVTHGGKRHKLMSHRVVWFLKTGEWPNEVIDHIDRNPSNNKFANLRQCSQRMNVVRRHMKQRRYPRGVVCASHTNKTNPYMAQLCGKCLGYFSTPELASQAYEEAFEKEFGNEWRF